MKIIPLSQGKFAQVDDENFDDLIKHKWYALKVHKTWYAARNGKMVAGVRSPFVYMHNAVLGHQGRTDHRDGDGLNNQRHNLRPATVTENAQNSRKHDGCASAFKGVSWNPARRKWQVTIRVNKKSRYCGLFTSEEDAAKAYDAAATLHFGEFAKINFPVSATPIGGNQNER